MGAGADERRILVGTIQRIYGWARRQVLQQTRSTGSTGSTASVADCVGPLFAQIDADGSGQIHESEFRSGLSSMGLQIDDRAVGVLLRHMDTDANGTLDADEFVQKMTELLEGEAASGSAILSSFCNLLDQTGQTADAVFAQLDSDGSGELDQVEWEHALQMLGIDAAPSAAAAAMKELDIDGGSTLEIAELLHRLQEFRRQRRVFAGTVLGKVCDYLKATNTSVVRVFGKTDRDGSGALDMLELQEALLRMGQDLSELEVQEMMRELAQSGCTAQEMTSRQFIDALKQFETEREVYTAKCHQLFNEVDKDGSGHLDAAEVQLLAEKMGFADQLADPLVHLTLEGLIADIESGDRDEEDDGKVTYDELLPWFLYVGRSYLPPPVYPTVHELDVPTEQKLRQLFDAIDKDGSGEVNEQEAKEGVLALWSYLDTGLVSQAFEAADEDSSGLIAFSEFDELVRCLQFLNAQRHTISEFMEEFGTGVDEEEFWVGVATFGIVVTDSQASRYFHSECARLGTSQLTARQFLTWVCRYECMDKNSMIDEETAAAAAAIEDLESRMTDFGDIFFDDLVQIVFTSHRGGYSQEKRRRRQELGALKRASAEVIQRGHMLYTAIKTAIGRHESFPELPEEVIQKLASSVSADIYYSGQNVTTQNVVEDTFHFIRRGACEVLVDGKITETLREGEPIGELALMYGTKRHMTVRTIGPCECYSINRAAYETAISSLPQDERQSEVMKMMHLFWRLVSGPDGSGRDEVDYRTYLKYHLRVTKTLIDAADEDEYDEDEERETALQDWEEDCSRYDLKTTGCLERPMFFDSLYQLVDLWSGDLSVSYSAFLKLVFYNIAEWIEADDARNKHDISHWKFKGQRDIAGQGERLEAIQTEARQKSEAIKKSQQDAAVHAEKQRVDAQKRAAEKKERLLRKQKELKAKQELEDMRTRAKVVESDVERKIESGVLNAEHAASERKMLSHDLQKSSVSRVPTNGEGLQGSSMYGVPSDGDKDGPTNDRIDGANANTAFPTQLTSGATSIGDAAPSDSGNMKSAPQSIESGHQDRRSTDEMSQSPPPNSFRQPSALRHMETVVGAETPTLRHASQRYEDRVHDRQPGRGNARVNVCEAITNSHENVHNNVKRSTANSGNASVYSSSDSSSDYNNQGYDNSAHGYYDVPLIRDSGLGHSETGGAKFDKIRFGGAEAQKLHTMPSVVCLHVPDGRRSVDRGVRSMYRALLQARQINEHVGSSAGGVEPSKTLQAARHLVRDAQREMILQKRKQKADIDQRQFWAGERRRLRIHNNLSTTWEQRPLDRHQAERVPVEQMAPRRRPPLHLRNRSGAAAQAASPRSSRSIMSMRQVFPHRPNTSQGLVTSKGTNTLTQTARPSGPENKSFAEALKQLRIEANQLERKLARSNTRNSIAVYPDY